jgi:hypothetical protein
MQSAPAQQPAGSGGSQFHLQAAGSSQQSSNWCSRRHRGHALHPISLSRPVRCLLPSYPTTAIAIRMRPAPVRQHTTVHPHAARRPPPPTRLLVLRGSGPRGTAPPRSLGVGHARTHKSRRQTRSEPPFDATRREILRLVVGEASHEGPASV